MTIAIDDTRLDATFAALANSTRRAILARLAEGAATVNELAEPFDMTLPAISKHIKVLERAGLGRRGHRAQFRPCAIEASRTAGGLDMGGAIPVHLGVTLRPDGRLPHATSTAAGQERKPMTNNNESANAVVIERSFDAPIDLIWKMWTDPEHFKAWYGPQGATIPVAEIDVRVGGRRFVGMEMNTPNGPMQMWFTGEHLAVDEPNRLAYTESMSDENGNVQSPSAMGMPEGHPTTTEVRVELASRGPDEDGDDPHRHPGRLPWRDGLEHGVRQAGDVRRRETTM